jgi:Uncharacterized protein conserved in bacteria
MKTQAKPILTAMAAAMASLVPTMLVGPSTAAAATYPEREIELVVPYSAGGSVDAMARNFSKEFADKLKTSVVVRNREGAGGTIGVGAVASAPADGYTVLFSPSSPLTQAPYLIGKVPYDVKDIQPLCQIFENPFVLAVKEDSPISSLQALLESARSTPGEATYGHAGLGSVPHLATAGLAQATNTELVDVPFKGDAQVLPQVLGGHVKFAAIGASNVAGKPLKVLAILGTNRLSAFPDVPAVSEFGVKDAVVARNGLYVRRDTPEEVRNKLSAACEAVTQSEAFRQAAGKLTQEVRYMDAAAFEAQLEQDHKVNRSLIQKLGLRKE